MTQTSIRVSATTKTAINVLAGRLMAGSGHQVTQDEAVLVAAQVAENHLDEAVQMVRRSKG